MQAILEKISVLDAIASRTLALMVTMWAPVSTTSQGACVVTHPAYFWVPGVIVIESHKGWVGRPDAMINVGWVIKEHIMRIRVEVMMIRR